MNKQELKDLAETTPFSFNEIRWLHEVLEPEYQNEKQLLLILDKIRSAGLSVFEYREIVIEAIEHNILFNGIPAGRTTDGAIIRST